MQYNCRRNDDLIASADTHAIRAAKHHGSVHYGDGIFYADTGGKFFKQAAFFTVNIYFTRLRALLTPQFHLTKGQEAKDFYEQNFLYFVNFDITYLTNVNVLKFIFSWSSGTPTHVSQRGID